MTSSQAFSTKFDKVCYILDKYGHDPHMLIAILQEIQAEYSYLPEDIMTYVATALGISPGQVFGAATFYAHFTLEPKGKYVIRVCDGTACHVKKSSDIIKTIQKELKLTDEKKTTPDMNFTLEMVACLGACGLAPVLVVNEDVHGAMDKDKTLKLLNDIREAIKANAE
ncbi:MAG: NAD(P)H-dependent oxidoreductase subunit E [Deltaproteobacteria bacterium]|jgi:NADH-quinone oxidoreductase subunit E|nr:NAD(P)H-dependent oxidoreductase subunit E [Deltaproteobacteria bacterium]